MKKLKSSLEKEIQAKSNIQNMIKYDPPVEQRQGKIRLDFNENTFGCSPKVLERFKEILIEDFSIYPENNTFRLKLAKYLNLFPSEVLPSNGTDEAIKIIMDAYLDTDQELILLTPSFTMYEIYALIAGAKIQPILYKTDLSFPLEDILAAISKTTRMIIIGNPNNPTGTIVKQTDIERILKKAKNALVIIDEAYFHYYGKSSKGLIRSYSNLVVLQTFSKAFGLAGLRIGYIMANSAIIETLQKVISPYSVNKFAQIAAIASIEDIDFLNQKVEEIRKNRQFLINQLQYLGVEVIPSEANFIIAYFGEKMQKVYTLLNNFGILVRDQSKKPLLKNYLRITIGTKEECILLVKAIQKIYSEIKQDSAKKIPYLKNLSKNGNQNYGERQ